jgi:AMP-activated protein kinase-like protein
MSRLRHAPVAFLLIAFALRAAQAQVDASVEGGASHLRQIDLPKSDVGTFGGRFRWDGLRGSLATSAIAAVAPGGAYTAQGILAGSLFADPLLPRRWELGASVSGFGGSHTTPTTGLQLLAREHFIGERVGAFIGASGGATVIDQIWRHAATAQVGGWWRVGRSLLSGAVSASDTKSMTRVDVEGAGVYHETNPVTYVDNAVFWQASWDRVELSVGGGARGGIRRVPNAAFWASASAVVWIAPRMALVVSRGRALEDFVRGVPQAHYLTAALRVGFQDHYNRGARGSPASLDALLISVARIPDGARHVITVRAANASTVEIMGDFTDWEPVSLTKTGDAWQLERELPQGAHRVAIRVDGGPWRVPSNLPRVSDDFGGTMGLLSIP